MKIKIFMCLLCLVCILFVSCSSKVNVPEKEHDKNDMSAVIDQLEDMLDNLKASQEKINAENKAQIDKLYA